MEISLMVNGRPRTVDADDRDTLAEILRDRLGLTGTKLGCEHGVCGSCTVLVDGQPVRSCLMLGGQAQGCAVGTVEDLAGEAALPAVLGEDGMRATGAEASLAGLDDLQRAFALEHGLQCGYCTPGFLMLLTAALTDDPDLDRHPDRLDEWLSSNLCRCTGYAGIRRAVARVCAERRTPASLAE